MGCFSSLRWRSSSTKSAPCACACGCTSCDRSAAPRSTASDEVEKPPPSNVAAANALLPPPPPFHSLALDPASSDVQEPHYHDHDPHHTAPCCSFLPDPYRTPSDLVPSPSAASKLPSELTRIATSLEKTISSLDATLRSLSLQMHGFKEICWQEHKTHDLFVSFFQQDEQRHAGWTVTPHAYGLATAFEAVFVHRPAGHSANADADADAGATLGFQSELDALPGLGHACGHNLIAISGVAAALSVASALVEFNLPGTVVLLGTPAEESGGGKLPLLRAGAYRRMDACLMVHPAPTNGTGAMLAVQPVTVTYTGYPAHAGAAPWQGRNALDAAVLAYTAISTLRQQTPPSHRLHGILVPHHNVVNIIPARTALVYNLRAPTRAELATLARRVERCFTAAADATACEVELEWGAPYFDVHNSAGLAGTYAAFVRERYGVRVPPQDFQASSDFGNVTYAVPALHAEYAIALKDPSAEGNHTAGFARAAASDEAHQRTLEAALAIAVTGCRVVVDRQFRNEVRREWQEWQDHLPAA